MNRNFSKLASTTAVLLGLAAAGTVWAGPTEGYWHNDAGRTLAPDAPQPAQYRALTLDLDQAAAYLRAAHEQGTATAIDLPLPNGGFSEFMVVDSGTLPPELQQKYPDILSFKGSDAQGRAVRLDVSPMGFQAMVFDPAGVWIVRPETLGSGSKYLSFNRAALTVPSEFQCGVHEQDIDPAGLNLGVEPMTQTGVNRRVYRTAVAANNRYITAVGGGTVAGGLAATVTALNRVTQVYESEMSIQLTLVPNNDLIMYPNAATDPFASNGTGVINNSTTVINDAIGVNNYDIGHVFTTGSGGVAGLRVVCGGSKARGTTGLPNPTGDAFYIDFVAHEMGHQFGGNHPFNGSLGNCSGGNRNGSTAYEPGSGSTIQSYAGICSADDLQAHSDPFFHAISLQEITDFTNGSGGACANNTTNPNNAPVINTASLPNGLTIPARTPFALNATATDADGGDTLYYSWEEWDLGPQAPLTAGDNGTSPIFRSLPPMLTGVRIFPTLSTVLGGAPIKGETLPTTNRTLKFRLTVRDQRPGSGTSQSADIALTVNNSAGPFKVTAPAAAANWGAGQNQTVTWDVAGTNMAPVNCSGVDINLSTDGGQTYSVPLAIAVPNSGSNSIIVPSVSTTQARVRVSCANNIFFNVSPGNFTVTQGAGTFTVGGTVSGLAGTGLALKLNSGASLPISTNGAFSFPAALANGAAYAVTVATQPNSPMQTCTVTNGSGTIAGANVTNVAVNCVTETPTTFTVGGTVSGLTGTGLKLKLNSGSNLVIPGNGPFVFSTPMSNGDSYTVSITAQPAGQTCTVNNGSGIIAGANVTDVLVDCGTGPVTYTVGGSVSGLVGTGLALKLNGGANLSIGANGAFTFPGSLTTGTAYAVTVGSQPVSQACSVANGSGTIGAANVTNVAVTCVSAADDSIFADGFEGDGAPEDCQLLQDPSFEATDPNTYANPYWTSTSTNYGDALCFSEGCNGMPARTGQVFAYFGGFQDEDPAEVGTVSQTVTIPAGRNYMLNFWMSVPFVTAPFSDTVKVKVDGTAVWTFTEPSVPESGGYTQRSVDLSAYADGNPHEIKIEYTHPAGSIMSDVLVDDVTLNCAP